MTNSRAFFHNEIFDGHLVVWFSFCILELPQKSTKEYIMEAITGKQPIGL